MGMARFLLYMAFAPQGLVPKQPTSEFTMNAFIDDNETDAEFAARRDAERLDAHCRKYKIGKYAEVCEDLTSRLILARYRGKAVMIDAKLTSGKFRVRYCPNGFQSSESFDVWADDLYTVSEHGTHLRFAI